MLEKPLRTPWLDYLRAFITVLVVAHHSSLAYTTFASFNKDAYILSTHPVVDTARSRALDIFEDFNDVFFMSLMFLISGIFVLPALARKGPRAFARDRFRRLFIPFAVAVTILMPLAYYPAWYLAKGNFNSLAYLKDYFTVESWPVGPPWFIWVLFAFNCLLALCYRSSKLWDSLSANAYGIYLLHYIFVTWIQFLLLPTVLPAPVKFGTTFFLSLALSWWVAALARKLPIVSKYV